MASLSSNIANALYFLSFTCRSDMYNTDILIKGKTRLEANMDVGRLQGAYDPSASAYK